MCRTPVWGLVLVTLAGCVPDALETSEAPLPAYCAARVEGLGQIDVETQYLPRVVQCENGAAGFEALKAQAVAARSYLYYRLRLVGYIRDGQQDQVYSCGRTPTRQQVEAVRATSGLVLAHGGDTVATFYVAGAEPAGPSCAGEGAGLANTERFVTYNEGRTGADVEPSPLGDTSNPQNRGCMSQNGADCLAQQGQTYDDILRFYYGADASMIRAVGPCVDPSTSPDQTPPDVYRDEDEDEDEEPAAPSPTCACDDSIACTPGCACDPECARCACDTSAECDLDAAGDRCACDAACAMLDGPFNADCGCDVDVQCNVDGDPTLECSCDPDCRRCLCDVDLSCNADARGCECGCDVDCGRPMQFNGRCGCDVDFECNADALSCSCGCDPDCD